VARRWSCRCDRIRRRSILMPLQRGLKLILYSWGNSNMKIGISVRYHACLLLTLAVLVPCAVVGAAESKQEVEKYPDGKTKATYSVNSKGVRDGAFQEFYEDGSTVKVQGTYQAGKLRGLYQEFHPNGKAKLKVMYKKGVRSGKYSEHGEDGLPTISGSYRDGKLHGARKRLDGRATLSEEIWASGVLILPKSPAYLKKQLKAISKASIKTVGEIPPTTPEIVARVNEPTLHAHREAALRRLMMYRCVCNLPYEDMVLDKTFIAHSEAACLLLKKLGAVSHFPPNPGLPEEQYQFARVGTINCNLQSDNEETLLHQTVRDFMWDSDDRNLQILGHRRRCINPAMLKTGFGRTGRFLAMWAPDKTRKEIPDYDFVAFPARGLQPVSLLRNNVYAWSVSLNPEKYRTPDNGSLKVKLVPARFDAKKGRIAKGSKPLEVEHLHVDVQQGAFPAAIIFRPKDLVHRPGKSFWVEITGVQTAAGEETKISYFVSFVKM